MILDIKFPTTNLDEIDEAVLRAARETATPTIPTEALETNAPKGRLIAGHHVGVDVYQTVGRDYWTYVPDQYDGSAANLVVFQDGGSYLKQTNATTVLDNMIAAGDLAPTIAVFVEPGDWAGHPKGTSANRSWEYDSINDAYVRFLLAELLPEAVGEYNITDDPMKRAICGMSSGGICAFNVAWERPDQFGLVLSHVGSFTNIRGGHLYPSRIRLNGAKPIRVFMQDGAADLNIGLGNWPIANFDMASSLTYREYDMRFEFGLGAHDFQHPAAILPQSLKWLFRD